MSKATQREVRRQARLARQRRQRNITIAAVAGVILILVALAAISLNRQQAANADATATAAAQSAASTAAATASAGQSATEQAIAASVGPMTFPGAVADAIKTVSGLEYKDVQVGTGAEAKSGTTVTVHYTGWLQDGTKFDSSVDKGQPFTFQLGTGGVIPGWDEGVAGMKVGGRRILIVPPELGYGAQVNGPIPANSTLVFEVVLLSVK